MKDVQQEVKKFLESNGQRLSNHLKQELTKKKKVATGNTLRSVGYDVTEDGSRIQLRITADEDIAYILGGRKKGKKIPPAEELEAWIKAKGFKQKGKTVQQSARSLGFAIARGVSKSGIRGTNLRSWSKKEDQKIFEDVSKLVESIYEENLIDAVTSDLDNQGIKYQVII